MKISDRNLIIAQIRNIIRHISIRFVTFMRKLWLNNFGLLSNSKVCSFSKLIRMICVILSFQIGSNLLGVSFSKSFAKDTQKSAFNNWMGDNRFAKYSVTIRVIHKIRCGYTQFVLFSSVSSNCSCFSQVSVLVKISRRGIALISRTHLYILSFAKNRCSPSF